MTSHHKHTKDMNTKERVLHRLNIIEGNIKAIRAMVEKDTYCIDVLHQSLAVQKSLKTFDMALMEQHLKTCVVHQVTSGKEDQMVKELIALYKFT